MTAYTIYMSNQKCSCKNPVTRTEGITIDDFDLRISICIACFGMTEILETGYVGDWSSNFEPQLIYTKP